MGLGGEGGGGDRSLLIDVIMQQAVCHKVSLPYLPLCKSLSHRSEVCCANADSDREAAQAEEEADKSLQEKAKEAASHMSSQVQEAFDNTKVKGQS